MTYKHLITFALDIGEVMLRSGAETYRVEDTINRILSHSEASDVQSYATPTGLFAAMDTPDGHHMSYVRRIERRAIHLGRIEHANALSRRFCKDEISLKEAREALEALGLAPGYPTWVMVVGISLSAGLFAIVFGGTFMDALVTTVAGIALAGCQLLFSGRSLSKFFVDLFGGFVVASVALLLLRRFGIGTNEDIILISGIMPLVPGVAITNAIRDTLHGDLVSGSARILDAFIVAASIATGVGLSIATFNVFMEGGFL